MANDPTFSEKITLQKEAEIISAQQEEKPVAKKRPKAGKKADAPVQQINKPVLIQGDKNVLHTIAQCCHPHYPQLIVGYVTRSKGVTIHRADCLIYQRIPDKEKKTVEVSWDDKD